MRQFGLTWYWWCIVVLACSPCEIEGCACNTGSGTTTYTYDTRDRVATLSYSYNAVGNLATSTSSTPGGYEMAYEYDALNRLSAALDHNNLDAQNQPTRTGYTYTAVGTLSRVTLPNTLQHFYNYNTRHQLTSCGIANAASQTLLGYAYTLNALGQRTQTDEFSTGTTPVRTVNYLYDALHRLTGESVTAVPAVSTGQVTYTLDPVGNRTARTSTLAGVPAQTQSLDTNDRLTSDTTDANGNTLGSSLNGVTTTDTYDFEDKLIRRTDSTGQQIDILYDAEGNRIAKTKTTAGQPTETTRYLVDTQNPTGYAQVVEEHTATGNTPALHTTVYAYGADLISQDRRANAASPWTLSYYLYDGGGHVRALANAAATITDEYTYDAYGILIARNGSTQNNYRYRGEQWDNDLQLYYQRARFLNQNTGRFWTQDTYEGSAETPASLHKYWYANGDAVQYADPSGNFSLAEMVQTISISAYVRTTTFLLNAPKIVATARWAAAAVTAASWINNPQETAGSILSMGPLGGVAGIADDVGMIVTSGANFVRRSASFAGRMNVLSSIEPKLVSAAGRIKEEFGDAVVGLRGSLVSGTKYDKVARAPVDIFNPGDFDADAFIVSDELAATLPKVGSFRDGRRNATVDAISAEIESALKSIPGYRTSLDKPFTFRVFKLEEFNRQVQKGAHETY
jgi:RHS repeat-associated protein